MLCNKFSKERLVWRKYPKDMLCIKFSKERLVWLKYPKDMLCNKFSKEMLTKNPRIIKNSITHGDFNILYPKTTKKGGWHRVDAVEGRIGRQPHDNQQPAGVCCRGRGLWNTKTLPGCKLYYSKVFCWLQWRRWRTKNGAKVCATYGLCSAVERSPREDVMFWA